MRRLSVLIPLPLMIVGACSVPASPVEPLAQATLIPGTALGPVELGKTSLRDFVDTYGPGHCALLAGDDFCGIELHFENQQLAFLWEIDAQEAYRLSDPPITHVTRGVDDFLTAHPRFGDAKLHSLSVQARKEPRDTFFRGGIDGRAKLFAPLDSVLGYMERPEPNAPDFVAGAQEDLPKLRHTCRSSGLSVYLLEPEGETGGEPYIDRMTIFPPDMLP